MSILPEVQIRGQTLMLDDNSWPLFIPYRYSSRLKSDWSSCSTPLWRFPCAGRVGKLFFASKK